MPMSPRSRLAALAVFVFAALACGSDDLLLNPAIPAGSATIATDITVNRRLYAETTYTVSGFIKVASGVTLTIDAGTTIKGDFNTVGSSLFILRGAQIIAAGTQDRPIVFTSSQPVGSRKAGDWGGLIIVGGGLVNRTDPTILEGTGVGSNNPQVNYAGGTSNTGNSGTLQYVRVEYAGYATAADQELNSFTFAAVGSGTTMDHLQSLFGLDDSFEWFGGAADARYLVSYESGDDHFDASEGFTGRVQYMIAYQSIRNTDVRAGAGSPSTDPQGIENDGCNGTNCNNGFNSTPITDPMFANFTLVGTGPGTGVDATSGGIGVLLRRGTGGYYVNGVVARWPRAGVSIRDQATIDRATAATPTLMIRNIYSVENGTLFESGSGRFTVDVTANSIEAAVSTTTAASVFTALPSGQPTSESQLDWSLSANAGARTGGTGAFSGALATKAGGVVTGTSYRGAADPNGAKWWQGWTKYARN